MKKASLILLCFLNVLTIYAQKKLEVEGSQEQKSVSTKIKDGVTSSRVIIESEFPLTYKSNMGDITNENVVKGILNSIYVDTIYFFLQPDDNKRVITISTDGYSSVKLSLQLNSKETYRYNVFDPNMKYTFQGNYDKGVEFFVIGNYTEALKAFSAATECPDVPSKHDAFVRIDNCKKASRYINNAKVLYEKAEKIRLTPNRIIESNTDSVTYYHNLAKRFRNEVLNINETDAYCKEYNEKYNDLLPEIDRIVTGKVVDNMNQGQAIAGVTIYGITDNNMHKLGQTDENGNFSIWVNGRYKRISFSPEQIDNYEIPFTQRLEIGQHYKLFIKLAPKKR